MFFSPKHRCLKRSWRSSKQRRLFNNKPLLPPSSNAADITLNKGSTCQTAIAHTNIKIQIDFLCHFNCKHCSFILHYMMHCTINPCCLLSMDCICCNTFIRLTKTKTNDKEDNFCISEKYRIIY